MDVIAINAKLLPIKRETTHYNTNSITLAGASRST